MEDTDSLDPALPWWLRQLSSPLRQKSHHQIWGEERAAVQNHLGCPGTSQGAREAPTEAQMAPCLPEPSCSHAKARGGGPGSPSSLHSQQTRHEQTKPRLIWCPLLSSSGAGRRGGPEGDRGPREAQVSPGYIQSHTLKASTHCPGLAKAESQPRLKKQPPENDARPSGPASPGTAALNPSPLLGTHTCSLRGERGGGDRAPLQGEGKPHRGQQARPWISEAHLPGLGQLTQRTHSLAPRGRGRKPDSEPNVGGWTKPCRVRRPEF